MTGAEFTAARERAGFNPAAVAIELGSTPAIVAGWEDGTIPIPRRVAQEIAWRAAVAERQAALAASGLPECEWVLAWDLEPTPSRTKQQVRRLESLAKHMAECQTCSARDQYVEERFPPMPPRPMPAWIVAINRLQQQIGRLPTWLRPAANGASLFFALTAVRVLFFAPQWLRTPGGWVMPLAALPAGAGIGAVLGALYGAVQAVRTSWGRRRRAGGANPGEQVT